MKYQTVKDMFDQGATLHEAHQASAMLNLLLPALKVKRNGRIDTAIGDKTPLGLYRVIKEKILCDLRSK